VDGLPAHEAEDASKRPRVEATSESEASRARASDQRDPDRGDEVSRRSAVEDPLACHETLGEVLGDAPVFVASSFYPQTASQDLARQCAALTDKCWALSAVQEEKLNHARVLERLLREATSANYHLEAETRELRAVASEVDMLGSAAVELQLLGRCLALAPSSAAVSPPPHASAAVVEELHQRNAELSNEVARLRQRIRDEERRRAREVRAALQQQDERARLERNEFGRFFEQARRTIQQLQSQLGAGMARCTERIAQLEIEVADARRRAQAAEERVEEAALVCASRAAAGPDADENSGSAGSS
jgi:chromosome segregation ATPase